MIIKQSVMSRIWFKFFSRFLKCFIFCCLTHFPCSWEAEVVHIILRKDQIPFWLASQICIQQALRFDLWIVGNNKSFKYQNLIEKIIYSEIVMYLYSGTIQTWFFIWLSFYKLYIFIKIISFLNQAGALFLFFIRKACPIHLISAYVRRIWYGWE